MTSTNTLLDSITNFLINLLPKFLGLLGLVILAGVALFWFSLRDQLVAQGDVYELPFSYSYVQPQGAIVGEYIEYQGDLVRLRLEGGVYILRIQPYDAPSEVEIELPRLANTSNMFIYESRPDPAGYQTLFTVVNGLDVLNTLLRIDPAVTTKTHIVNFTLIKQLDGQVRLNELSVVTNEG
jgi:hypothetical protein